LCARLFCRKCLGLSKIEPNSLTRGSSRFHKSTVQQHANLPHHANQIAVAKTPELKESWANGIKGLEDDIMQNMRAVWFLCRQSIALRKTAAFIAHINEYEPKKLLQLKYSDDHAAAEFAMAMAEVQLNTVDHTFFLLFCINMRTSRSLGQDASCTLVHWEGGQQPRAGRRPLPAAALYALVL
jgi:hypothetical protein